MHFTPSARVFTAIALALSIAACAEGERDPEATSEESLEQTPQQAEEPDTAEESAEPYYPCSTFATIYRSAETAQQVADAWPGRLLCLRSIDDAGVGNGWTVSYGSDCKCAAPQVLPLPTLGADAGR